MNTPANLELEAAEIRRRIDTWAKAIRAMDLEGVMSIYAPEVVSFDVDPPLQYRGVEAKRKRWSEVFATFQHPIAYELRHLSITCGDDLAFGHSLNRIRGSSTEGIRSGFWLRWSMCFRKIDGNWLIVHEQLSVPADLKSGKALLNLEP